MLFTRGGAWTGMSGTRLSNEGTLDLGPRPPGRARLTWAPLAGIEIDLGEFDLPADDLVITVPGL